MPNSKEQSAPSATAARRATGAMFFSVFGGAWLMLWAYRSFGATALPSLAIGAITIALFLFCRRRYAQNKGALLLEQDGPAQARVGRIFNIINAAQWIGILVVNNVLINIGLADWVVPAAILIIGLHFLPLAKLFSNPPHYITGAALIALSLAYPRLAPQGPRDAIGCLMAGLILWASALWAVRAGQTNARSLIQET